MVDFLWQLLGTCLLLFSPSNSKEVGDKYAGMVVKGNRNALFLIEKGARRQFPDFFTFNKMGFNQTNVKKIKDHILTSIPLGPMIAALPQPPPFRPDDHMFHEQCGDPDRMVVIYHKPDNNDRNNYSFNYDSTNSISSNKRSSSSS
jgi:hypothetical protein